MRIEVDHRFAYECEETVKVGDMVVLPTPYWMVAGSVHIGKVTALTSDYDGDCLKILRVLPEKEVSS